MPKIRNVSPYGDLDVPLLRCCVKAGETVDVTDDDARRLLPQEGNYEPVDKAAKAIHAELTNVPEPDLAPEPATNDAAEGDQE